jgi:hypothetical protein
MARTVGRKIRPGEKRRAQCGHCNTLWDLRDLRRDSDGLWTCPQEGPGKGAVALTRGNAEGLRDYAQRLRPTPGMTGRYGDKAVTPTANLTGMLLSEDGDPITTEDGINILQG